MLALTLSLLLTAPSFKTVAETSNAKRSGTYAEVEKFCRGFAESYPTSARCEVFGTTPEGRPMLAMVVGHGPHVVLAQGGIHAGEIDGKDAGLALVRDVLEGRVLPGITDALTFVFVPVFNVDGHENAGPDNRPNQLGPETPGFRVTAQRLNLNRDYVKADAPEMRGMLALLRRYDPILYIDLHTTDGMDFQNDVAVMIEPRFGFPGAMRALGAELSATVLAKLRASRHLPLDFYPSANDETNPLSGWEQGVSTPRFSHGYWPLWRRYAVLVETHALKPNAERIRASRDTLIALLEIVRDHGARMTQAAAPASLAGTPVELSYEAAGEPITLDFAGVAYTSEPSVITGKTWVSFNPQKKTTWETPFIPNVAPKVVVEAPRGGYVVAPAWAPIVAPVLAAHGLTYHPLKHAQKLAREVFAPTKIDVSAKTSEGRTRVVIDGAWRREDGTLESGALFVPIDQPGAAVVMHLLEPKAPDSIVSWGFMNTVFEAREYVELRFLEPFARALMQRDKTVKEEFDALVARGASEAERIDFFYRRHPSHDRQRDVYPVMRVEQTL